MQDREKTLLFCLRSKFRPSKNIDNEISAHVMAGDAPGCLPTRGLGGGGEGGSIYDSGGEGRDTGHIGTA
jgi:hypothetical protein